MPELAFRVRRALLFSFLLLIAPAARAAAEDSFVLALTWQPGFCAAHGASPECADPAPRLVLHGLWPDWDVNGDGKRNAADDYCIAGESNRAAIAALDRDGKWQTLPPVKLSGASRGDLAAAMPGSAAALDRHEWWKHGTCSGLAADDYFATAIALLRETERGSLAGLIVKEAGRSVARSKLLAAFEKDFGAKSARALTLVCDGDTLQEIRIRLKRASVTQGLTAKSLSMPAKAPRADCGSSIPIPR